MSAALRALYSFGSPPASGAPLPLVQRLLQVPWTFTVAKVTLWNVQRRFSTHGVGKYGPAVDPAVVLVVPTHGGAVWTSVVIVFCPNDWSVEKKSSRSRCSRSSSLNEPFDGRSQSVQSLSPGVKNAGWCRELRYPIYCR